MRQELATRDRRVAEFAARQHGVITARQLEVCGLDSRATARRVSRGTLHRLHRAVYAVGHQRISIEGRWLAAVLACGPRAALSYTSAASLWGMLPPREGPVEVSAPGNGGRKRRAEMHLRRCPTLTPEQVTHHQGIPVTTPARTMIDIRRVLSPVALRQAVRQADILGLAIGEAPERDRTRSELESAFLRLCDQRGLPQPLVNAQVGSLIVDFLWPGQNVVVEADGYRYHRGRDAFERDRSRDLRLKTMGFDVIRLTHTQIMEQPQHVASALRHVLKE